MNGAVRLGPGLRRGTEVRETEVSILINSSAKIITQGMTGNTGTFHTEQAR
jgi:hypothetical protein